MGGAWSGSGRRFALPRGGVRPAGSFRMLAEVRSVSATDCLESWHSDRVGISVPRVAACATRLLDSWTCRQGPYVPVIHESAITDCGTVVTDYRSLGRSAIGRCDTRAAGRRHPAVKTVYANRPLAPGHSWKAHTSTESLSGRAQHQVRLQIDFLRWLRQPLRQPRSDRTSISTRASSKRIRKAG